jgi:hypothetical protein
MGFGKRNQNTKEHKYPESFPSRISYTPPSTARSRRVRS